MNGLDHWNFYDVGGHATLWFPAPEWAHQLIDRLASLWTEYPWTTKIFLSSHRFFNVTGGASPNMSSNGEILLLD
jgi:hypothetical protein